MEHRQFCFIAVIFMVITNAVIIRDSQVLSVRKEIRNYCVTYRQRLNDHPTTWQNLCKVVK